jgi:SAM-dependent methyltransferase
LRAEAQRASARRPYRLLDVGCGAKPYKPLFEADVSEYVGVDIANPDAELEGRIEALPVADASFDLVLCTQVLEHAEDAAQGVRELHRVTAPGGRVLASTHGVQAYHPSPTDLWRWTHEGLAKLFRDNGDWSELTVEPGSGTTACLGMLVGKYVEILLGRGAAARPLVAAINRSAEALDARVARLAHPGPGAIFANYHVTAVRG